MFLTVKQRNRQKTTEKLQIISCLFHHVTIPRHPYGAICCFFYEIWSVLYRIWDDFPTHQTKPVDTCDLRYELSWFAILVIDDTDLSVRPLIHYVFLLFHQFFKSFRQHVAVEVTTDDESVGAVDKDGCRNAVDLV